jgi:hypothetical protein
VHASHDATVCPAIPAAHSNEAPVAPPALDNGLRDVDCGRDDASEKPSIGEKISGGLNKLGERNPFSLLGVRLSKDPDPRQDLSQEASSRWRDPRPDPSHGHELLDRVPHEGLGLEMKLTSPVGHASNDPARVAHGGSREARNPVPNPGETTTQGGGAGHGDAVDEADQGDGRGEVYSAAAGSGGRVFESGYGR